jgi:hypothetical protein
MLTPDGRHVAITFGFQNNNLWMVEGFEVEPFNHDPHTVSVSSTPVFKLPYNALPFLFMIVSFNGQHREA